MADDLDRHEAQEQLERRRLSRLVDSLPVFSGFATPDGHLMQARPDTSENFLWSLPAFAYAHDSVTQIVDLCERACLGERVQVERLYRKDTQDSVDVFGRGLLTLTPIEDEPGHVGEIAVTLIDCDENGLALPDSMAKTRLANANIRIESMLSLAQTVIEATFADQKTRNSKHQIDLRDRLYNRLDALASIIDSVSDPEKTDMPVSTLIDAALSRLDDKQRRTRIDNNSSEGVVPIATTPLIALLFAELLDNAQRYGALRDDVKADRRGRVSIQSEVRDTRHGRILRLHWMEDGGPPVPGVLVRGFGLTLGEKLFPQITGGQTHLLNSEEGLSWTFEMPIPADVDPYDRMGDDDGLGYIP